MTERKKRVYRSDVRRVLSEAREVIRRCRKEGVQMTIGYFDGLHDGGEIRIAFADGRYMADRYNTYGVFQRTYQLERTSHAD